MDSTSLAILVVGFFTMVVLPIIAVWGMVGAVMQGGRRWRWTVAVGCLLLALATSATVALTSEYFSRAS